MIALSIKLIPPTPALKLFSMGTPLPEWDAATMHVVCGSALVQQGEMARIRSCAALSRRIVLVVQLSFFVHNYTLYGRRTRRHPYRGKSGATCSQTLEFHAMANDPLLPLTHGKLLKRNPHDNYDREWNPHRFKHYGIHVVHFSHF